MVLEILNLRPFAVGQVIEQDRSVQFLLLLMRLLVVGILLKDLLVFVLGKGDLIGQLLALGLSHSWRLSIIVFG